MQPTQNNQSPFNLADKIALVAPYKLAVFLFFISFLVYIRTVNFEFVWDDERVHLTANKELMDGKIKSFWTKPYFGLYIPMSYSTWVLTKNLFYSEKEISPVAFHLLNIIFHSINGVFVFLLLLLLLKHTYYSLTGAILFLIHPMQVESVAWISEFRGIYSSFFCLLALLSLFRINFFSGKNSIQIIFSKQFLFSTLCFTLAVLSKPSALTLPYIAILMAFFLQKNSVVTLSKCIMVWIVLSIPFLFITSQLQPGITENFTLSFYERIILSANSLFFYIRKLILPYPLAADYGLTPKLILSYSYSSYIAFFIVALFIFLVSRFKKYNLALAGTGIIVVSLLPTLGFVAFSFQENSNVADRYIYFGTLGLSLLFISLIKAIPNQKKALFLVASVLITFLTLNIKQVSVWKNEFSLWDHTLKHFQNSPDAYYNRGVEFSKKEKFNEAINDFTSSLWLNPKFKDALFNRINSYEHIGNFEAGFKDCETYISIDSLDGSIYLRKARLYYKTGNIQMAIYNTKKAEALGFKVGEKFKTRLLNALPANQ